MKTSRISLGTMLAAFACVALAIGISVAAVGPSPADARDASWQQGGPAMGAMTAGGAPDLGSAE